MRNVADGAGEADADLLRQGADHESGHQGDEHGSVLGARAGLADGEHAGEDADAQADDQQHGQDGAGRLVRVMLAAQGVALLQEERARGDAQDEADEADPGVQVAGGHTDDHAQWTSQKNQSADHSNNSQKKADHGRGAGGRAVFPGGHGNNESSGYQTCDFRAHILYNGCRVQLGCACNVADKAGDTKCHVCRIS